MCNVAMGERPWLWQYIPDQIKTQGMCDNSVNHSPYMLEDVPDQFVTQQQVKLWHDDNDCYDDDGLIEWYDGYKKRKAQKAKIKEGLLPNSWHPSGWWDWCVPADKKKETEKLFLTI